MYIDPHVHMVSRTTDDYHRMATAGCLAVSEPAFWAGFDRGSAEAFCNYFDQLTVYEPKRAAKFGIKHYTWICMNPKEAEDLELSREVLKHIPHYLQRPSVVGIGEIGLNRVTRNEFKIFEEQVELAIRHEQLIMIHTPHLEDKFKGTKITLETLNNFSKLDPGRVIIDHMEEHTTQMVLDRGYWAGITLYPFSKASIPRAVDIIEQFHGERLMVNSGGDWGPSDPLTVPSLQVEMRLRGHQKKLIDQVTCANAAQFMAQSGRFMLNEEITRAYA